MTKYLQIIRPITFKKYVIQCKEKWNIQKARNNFRTFKYFSYSRYGTEVASQESNRPSESMAEGKKYFSEKHKHYGYKAERSILSVRFCFGCTTLSPRSLFELNIFCGKCNFHVESSKRHFQEIWIFPTMVFQNKYQQIFENL